MDLLSQAEFIASETQGKISQATALSVLRHVISGPEAVMDLWRDGRRVAIGVLIDTCETAANGAELTIVGSNAEERDLDLILTWAEARVRKGPRTRLEVPQWRPGLVPELWLQKQGFTLGYTYFDLQRSAQSEVSAVAEFPGLRWEGFSERWLTGLHSTLALAFRGVPGAYVPQLEPFGRRCAEHDLPFQILVSNEGNARVVGFFRNVMHGGDVGEIAILGRHPDFRGKGLGEVVLRRAVGHLQGFGAKTLRLEVAAPNEAALVLYRRNGFAQVSARPVYVKTVRAQTP